jgi:hypothetical protein
MRPKGWSGFADAQADGRRNFDFVTYGFGAVEREQSQGAEMQFEL